MTPFFLNTVKDRCYDQTKLTVSSATRQTPSPLSKTVLFFTARWRNVSQVSPPGGSAEQNKRAVASLYTRFEFCCFCVHYFFKMIPSLAGMEPVDYVRFAAIALGFLATSFSSQKTFLRADVVFSVGMGVGWLCFPNVFLDFQVKLLMGRVKIRSQMDIF